jgi:hypothetical protein
MAQLLAVGARSAALIGSLALLARNALLTV